MPDFKNERSHMSIGYGPNFLQDRVLALKLMASGCSVVWPSDGTSNQLLPCVIARLFFTTGSCSV